MRGILPAIICAIAICACSEEPSAQKRQAFAAKTEAKAEEPLSRFDQRRADWRIGAVTYQIFVDRFAPSESLDAKRHLYDFPKSLKDWSEQPRRGELVPSAGIWTHELSFWGGDLNSINGKVDYLKDLGVEVVYLNPIQMALSNHKYDAIDYKKISEEYGTFDDLRTLTTSLHNRNMKLILDGVFNHVGRHSVWFKDAQASESSKYRDWFHFGEEYQNGYIGWWGVGNLPEVNWQNPEVAEAIVHAPDSVVRHWFQYGIDGWRLDVATELGFENLKAITDASHEEKPGSLVIGEIWSYPSRWTESVDAVMHMPLRFFMFQYIEDKLSGAQFGQSVADMIADAGTDPVMRSWIVLDNHDTPRLKTLYPDERDRAFLQSLQFSLPGAPLIYYGVEAGMVGGHDPGSRGPMEWDKVGSDNPEFMRLKKLIDIRASSPALKLGDFVPLASNSALAFLRLTDRSAETVLVVANATDEEVSETLLLRDPILMSGDTFKDAVTGETFKSEAAVLTLSVPAKTVRILKPERWPDLYKKTGHSPYKAVP